MSRTFQSATIAEFQDIVATFPWTRRVTEVHLHHTWRPRQADYRGQATILSMWRYHTVEKGWSDIAQHVTVAPDGTIWIGRNFNWSPASAAGFNGNAQAGPFMIEMIGDFDHDRERLTAEQQGAALSVTRIVQEHFGLAAEALRFHSEMSSKSCPGNSLDKASLIAAIGALRLPASGSRAGRGPFEARAGRAGQLVRDMKASEVQPDDLSAADHPVGLEESARGGGEDEDLPDSALADLADHVVNLERGVLSDSGRMQTDEGDLDRIFGEILPAEIESRRRRGLTTHLLLYAHGGLSSESRALATAWRQLPFWRANGIYPVFFVWETGFGETIRQMIADATSRTIGGRDARAFFTDALIEEVVRALKGGRVWDGMKTSARLASDDQGGAAKVAIRVAQLANDHPGEIQVHAVGHSAGAIFHSHFLPRLVGQGGRVTTCHLLAPAARNDLFNATLAPLVGAGLDDLTIFTMRKAFERRDTVTPAYRKSLLYLIHHALEREREAPILGLETSLRADRATQALFGLDGTPRSQARVVWSVSDDGGHGSSSASTTHGGFDDDPATMSSVAQRILGLTGGGVVAPFPSPPRGPKGGPFSGEVDWPEPLGDVLTPLPFVSPPSSPAPVAPPPRPVALAASGRRRALCIGINAYPGQELQGCVADAELWGRTLSGLGYEVAFMRDGDATGSAIRRRIQEEVNAARAGDSVVIQFAGHGTGFRDVDGDEQGRVDDQCLCAVDCDSAEDGLVVDDELRAIIGGLADGALLTCFFDCCHSGTATRAALRASRALNARSRARGADTRARFLPPTPYMRQSYLARLPAIRAASARAPVQREALFSACTADELAYESDRQGDFTRHATQAIAQGIEGVTNRDFVERVLVAFGEPRRQTPELDCDLARRSAAFLRP